MMGDPYLRTDKWIVPFLMRDALRRAEAPEGDARGRAGELQPGVGAGQLKPGVHAFLDLEYQLTSLWEHRKVRWPSFGEPYTEPPRMAVVRPPDSYDKPDETLAILRRTLKMKAGEGGALGVPEIILQEKFVMGLRALKGVRLAVWMAYFVRADSRGVAALSNHDLTELTAYSRVATVSAARGWLKRHGWLRRVQRVKGDRQRLKAAQDQTRGETGGESDPHRVQVPRPSLARAAKRKTVSADTVGSLPGGATPLLANRATD